MRFNDRYHPHPHTSPALTLLATIPHHSSSLPARTGSGHPAARTIMSSYATPLPSIVVWYNRLYLLLLACLLILTYVQDRRELTMCFRVCRGLALGVRVLAAGIGSHSSQCVRFVAALPLCFRPLIDSPWSAILESKSHTLQPVVCCLSLPHMFAAGTCST